MELKQIEYFLQLAQTQHMSQTADLLNIAQPTLSKSLKNLEKELGTPLFDRVGNRLHLNDSGKRFYATAKQAMQLLNTATLQARRSVYEISGNISIVCLTFAPIIMPCICDYMELNPMVNVQLLQYNHAINRATDTDYDFILYTTQDTEVSSSNDGIWISQTLFSEDCFLVVGPDHPRYADLDPDSDVTDLHDWKDESFITMRLDNHFTETTYQFCQEAGFFPKSYFQTDDFLLKMNMIRRGTAVAFLPESCLEEAEYLCPGLKVLRLNGINTRRSILVKRKIKSLLSEASLDFWDFLMEYYRLAPDTRD